MLISDSHLIGNRLYEFRKKKHLSQIQVAEAADLSVRAYANIERGTAGMRVNTMIKICEVLEITPDMLLVDDKTNPQLCKERLIQKIELSSPKQLQDFERVMTLYLSLCNSPEL